MVTRYIQFDEAFLCHYIVQQILSESLTESPSGIAIKWFVFGESNVEYGMKYAFKRYIAQIKCIFFSK